MSTFASKTPRDLNHDPNPYVDQWGIDRNDDGDPAGYDFDALFHFDPRPEFDHVQHNDPNPILTALRRRFPSQQNSAWAIYQDTLDALTMYGVAEMQRIIDRDGIDAVVTDDHIDHARRVLTRLGRFSR